MKKLLLSALIASMLMLPLGTVALADEPQNAPSIENTEFTPGDAPARNYVDAMVPALHAVLLAMENQDVQSFTTDDALLSWEMLYNLLSMYGQMDDRASYLDEQLILPAETVMDFSAALFSVPLTPDALPDELTDRLTYDADTDEYRLYCGSDALSEVRIDSTVASSGDLLVTGSLVFLPEDTALATFSAKLAMADNLFGYTIAELDVN